jgi:hypothetical protein
MGRGVPLDNLASSFSLILTRLVWYRVLSQQVDFESAPATSREMKRQFYQRITEDFFSALAHVRLLCKRLVGCL